MNAVRVPVVVAVLLVVGGAAAALAGVAMLAGVWATLVVGGCALAALGLVVNTAPRRAVERDRGAGGRAER